MKEKIRRVLQVIIGTCFGVFIGTSLWRWEDFRQHPDLYAASSAPWYTSVIVSGLVMAGIILVLGIVWFILGREKK